MPPPMIATLRDWVEVVVDDMLFGKKKEQSRVVERDDWMWKTGPVKVNAAVDI